MPDWFPWLVIAIVVLILGTIGSVLGWLVRKLLHIRLTKEEKIIQTKRVIAALLDWFNAFIIGWGLADVCVLPFIRNEFKNIPAEELRHLCANSQELTILVVICLYFILFESSLTQQTLGKENTGLYVTDSEGKPISIWPQ